ncbi:MAG: hypothetical protein ACJAZO_001662 [Myxococcota bacterium]|jgi:hypothetical protein
MIAQPGDRALLRSNPSTALGGNTDEAGSSGPVHLIRMPSKAQTLGVLGAGPQIYTLCEGFWRFR